jgi:hypothetical protein
VILGYLGIEPFVVDVMVWGFFDDWLDSFEGIRVFFGFHDEEGSFTDISQVYLERHQV